MGGADSSIMIRGALLLLCLAAAMASLPTDDWVEAPEVPLLVQYTSAGKLTIDEENKAITFMALSEDPPRSKLSPVNPDAFAETMSNGMTQAYRDATLTEHNQLRRTIVQASDMIELTYDMQLEAVAQNYLNSLGSGSFSHNSRATADYAALGGSGYVGENWYSSSPTDAASKWCTFVWPTSWGGNGCSEEQNFFATNPNGFAGASIPEYSGRAYGSSPGSQCRGGTTGHYTQVLWAKSARVGCGYTSSGGTLCNYAPGGNVGNQDFFTPGAACSACPSGYTTCNNGLCSNGHLQPPVATKFQCCGKNQWRKKKTCSRKKAFCQEDKTTCKRNKTCRGFWLTAPTKAPTRHPTRHPTPVVTLGLRRRTAPTKAPTRHPTKAPTRHPTNAPTRHPTKKPTRHPTKAPTKAPTRHPTRHPTKAPTYPTRHPTNAPTRRRRFSVVTQRRRFSVVTRRRRF